jgi:hypothetical protein
VEKEAIKAIDLLKEEENNIAIPFIIS